MAEKKPIKVLMIDDEKLLLDIYKLKFENNGFEVFACYSADEGLALLRTGYVPDIILLDITMPEKSGYQFLEEMKGEGLARDTPVVTLTNEGQDGEKQRMWELGVLAHLVKADYLPSEVVTVVRGLLEKEVQKVQ